MAGGKRRKPKIIKDKKERGEWAESVFIARAKEQGLAVSKPQGDSTSFDCVVGRPGKFAAVQVKSTIATLESGKGYICSTCSSHKIYRAGAFDFLAAYVIPEDVWYIIPETKIRGMRSISLYPRSDDAKYEQYREAWDLLREATGVKEEDQSENSPASRKTGETRGTPGSLIFDNGEARGTPATGIENPEIIGTPETSHPANPTQGGAASVDLVSAPSVVEKRMQNAFSFFRKQIERQG